MYKRKGCELWTIEERDVGGFCKDKDTVLLMYLKVHKDIDLDSQIDVILEIDGIRYLGYLEGLNLFQGGTLGDFLYSPICYFHICQERYLEGVEIVKEVEYDFNPVSKYVNNYGCTFDE